MQSCIHEIIILGCIDDAPEIVHAAELLTTLRLTFTPSTGGTPITVTWKDTHQAGHFALPAFSFPYWSYCQIE